MAVSNVNMRIFENQITVLLGHNGAGKSTIMNMATGKSRKHDGSVKLCCNVFTEVQNIKRDTNAI